MFNKGDIWVAPYMDVKSFRSTLERVRHALDLRIGEVLRVVMLEAWLRNLGRAQVVQPNESEMVAGH